MRLFFSTTSPYARIVRIALVEKQCAHVRTSLVDPWSDPAELLAANSAARVPVLVTPQGVALTETLLIVMWLEHRHPRPTLLGRDPTETLARAGIAIGVIDAAAHIIIGRRMTDARFDEAPVGMRRRRSIVQGLQCLEASPRVFFDGAAPDLASIATVVALDYLRFRFPDAAWMPQLDRLDDMARYLGRRPSFDVSQPHG